MIVSTVRSKKSSLTTISNTTLRNKAVADCRPPNNSNWPRRRPKAWPSQIVIRVTSIFSNASRTALSFVG